MHAAILLFDRFNALDAVTPHAVLSSAGLTVTFIGESVGPVRGDSRSIELTADAVLEELPAPDIIVVPGGAGTHHHLANGTVHRWLRSADLTAGALLAVGAGALIPAAAGLLTGRRAAANDQTSSFLRRHGVLPTDASTIIDGKYGTATDATVAGDLVLDVLDRLRKQEGS